jgi:hypothetical protein
MGSREMYAAARRHKFPRCGQVQLRANVGKVAEKIVCAFSFVLNGNHGLIRVYDDAGSVTETHEHKGEFKEW